MLYREEWKSRFFRYSKKTEPLLVSLRYDHPVRLGYNRVKSQMTKIVESIGLRPKLEDGKRRHEIMIDHGFRKYFNTMLRRAKVNYLDKEEIMGHDVGLEKHYERYEESDSERFPEYQKAISFLTIDDTERQKIKIEELTEENTKMEILNQENNSLKEDIKKMKIDVQKEINKKTKIKTLHQDQKIQNLENTIKDMQTSLENRDKAWLAKLEEIAEKFSDEKYVKELDEKYG